MNNRSIAWWLRQIGLPQYTKTLESEYYGLEGLLSVTDGELKDAGIEDATHRETILNQLSRHRQTLDPHSASYLPDKRESGVKVIRRVSRKYSLGSSMDLVKPRKDLFRHSVLPRLQRSDKKHRLSASCSQLRPLNEDNTISEVEHCQDTKRSNQKTSCFLMTNIVNNTPWDLGLGLTSPPVRSQGLSDKDECVFESC